MSCETFSHQPSAPQSRAEFLCMLYVRKCTPCLSCIYSGHTTMFTATHDDKVCFGWRMSSRGLRDSRRDHVVEQAMFYFKGINESRATRLKDRCFCSFYRLVLQARHFLLLHKHRLTWPLGCSARIAIDDHRRHHCMWHTPPLIPIPVFCSFLPQEVVCRWVVNFIDHRVKLFFAYLVLSQTTTMEFIFFVISQWSCVYVYVL